MTFADIENIRDETLTPLQVGAFLHINPQSIRQKARECPEKLGFPVIVIGSRVLIPKRAFIQFMQGKEVR